MKAHNLVQLLAQTVQRYPNHLSCLWNENGQIHSLTYQKMWNQIRDFAFGLECLGICPGSKVAILSENHPRWIISHFAILSLGAITVPIDPSIAPNRLKFILEHAKVKAIIIENSQLMDQHPFLSAEKYHIILLEKKETDQHKALQFETVVQMGQTISLEELDWAYPAVQPAELATIVYHSSKGIMLSHANLLSSIENTLLSTPISHHDQILSYISFSSVFSQCMGLYLPIRQGACILIDRNQPFDYYSLKKLKPTILIGHISLFENFSTHIKQKINSSWFIQKLFPYAIKIAKQVSHYTQKGWNWVIPPYLRLIHALVDSFIFSTLHKEFGGALRFMISNHPLSTEISVFFQQIGIPVIESYELASCPPGISTQRLPNINPGTAGKSIPGTELRTLNDGEILVKSSSAMIGYYRDEKATSQVLINGWLHTGIIGEIDDEGWLHIKGLKSS